MSSTRHELRCDCASQRLLAHYGRDENGKLYILVASYRAREVRTKVFTNHSVKIFCASCKRWFSVLIEDQQISKQELRKPPALPEEQVKPRAMLDNRKPRL